MIAYTYPLLDLFWSIFVFFGLLLWLWVLTTIFVDIFRSRDIGGFAKALWFVSVLVLPLLGTVVYLIARGRSMHERSVREAEKQDEAFRHYLQEAAKSSGPSTADELSKLDALAERGVITDQELKEQKAKLLAEEPSHPTAA